LTAAERHVCNPEIVSKSCSVNNDFPAFDNLKQKSVRYLVSLIKSIFGPQIAVYVESIDPAYIFSKIYHAPVISLDSIDPTHWAWKLIGHRKIRLYEKGLEMIIDNILGTFTVIVINKGEFQGCYLLAITRDNTQPKA
jgi:hypothetical protein